MAAPAAPLATPEQLEAHTEGRVTAADPRAALTLAGVTASLRRWCGWHVAPVLTETLILDGPGGRELALPSLHVLNLVSVLNGDADVDLDYLEWSALGNVRGPVWSSRYRSVRVTLEHGYEVDEVPDLVTAVLSVSARFLASPMGATSEQAGSVSVSWGGTGGMVAALGVERDAVAPFRIGVS